MKTLGMLAIIWGHCFPELFTPFLYAFSVGMFFFVSGYLARREPSHGVFWRKLVRTLLIPYFILSVLKAIQNVCTADGPYTIGAIVGGFHSVGDIVGCGKLWFVYTLMVLKIVFQFTEASPRRFSLLVVPSIMAAVAYRHLTDGAAWAVGNAFLAMPFFLAGHLFRHHPKTIRCLEWLLRTKRWKSLSVALLSAIVTYAVSYYNGAAWMYMGEYGRWLILFEVSAFSGILFMLTLSCLLDGVHLTGCKQISIGSMVVLAYHQDVNHPMLKWIRSYEWSDLTTDMAMMLSSIVTLLAFIPIVYLLSRYFPVITGGRKLVIHKGAPI